MHVLELLMGAAHLDPQRGGRKQSMCLCTPGLGKMGVWNAKNLLFMMEGLSTSYFFPSNIC